LNGKAADVVNDSRKNVFMLEAGEDSAALSFSAEEQLVIHAESGGTVPVENWSLTLPFPLEAEFHLPEFPNIGRVLDRDITDGDFYSARLAYNFFLVGLGDIWLRIMSKQKRFHRLEVHVERHRGVFLATAIWHRGEGRGNTDAHLGLFPSMEAALKDYEDSLVREINVTPLRENSSLPEWIHNVKLMFEIDMMRSYGDEITHDYEDVIRLSEELHREGCPENTLFHIPGWNGPFDSTYPTYRAHPGLGGEQKFRQMIDTLHHHNFRVMLHTLGWGIDPFHPDIDNLRRYVLKDEDGNLRGYKTGEDAWPPSRRIRFKTDRVLVSGMESSCRIAFETVEVPALCEASLTIGGFKGRNTQIRVGLNGRNQITPAGWFSSHEYHEFPYPFQLDPGRNRIELETTGESEPDWSRCWYKISRCFVPKSIYLPSTRPILKADTSNPEWIRLYVDEAARAVTDYHIDCLYVDATTFYSPRGSKSLFEALKKRLPNTPLGAEWCDSVEELGWWAFSYGAAESLVSFSRKLGEPSESKSPVRRGLDERYAWLNKPSPVCGFVSKYIYYMSSANSFVPVGKISNVYPKRLLYTEQQELWDIMKDGRRLNFIPKIRVNYRDYGLDEHTKRLIGDLNSES
jgi:hypothetical protein